MRLPNESALGCSGSSHFRHLPIAKRSQMYLQRYIQHFPAAGEIVIFDRSWYNRTGVEHVMGFCSENSFEKFLELCPTVENYIVNAGIILIKYWLEVGRRSNSAALRRESTIPHGSGNLAPWIWNRFGAGTNIRAHATACWKRPTQNMLLWHLIRSDDKKRARLNCIRHFLSLIPYRKAPREKVKLPARKNKGSYDDQASLKGRHFIPEKY